MEVGQEFYLIRLECFPQGRGGGRINNIRFQGGRTYNCYSDALTFTFLLEPACEGEGAFINRNRQAGARTLTENSSSFVELLNCLTKTDCLIDIQQVVSMLIESGDAFGGEPSSECKYEIVERKLSLDLAVRDCDVSFERINVSNFGFNEVDSSIQQCLP